MAERDFSHLSDVMGSLPMLKRYIVICLAFELDDYQTTATDVETALKDALTRLASAFPFLTGQVVMEGRREGHSGRPKIIPLQPTISLHSKDLRHDPEFPSMQQMRQAQYPISMLNAEVLSPAIAVSWSSEGFENTAPVFMLQTNFVRGGLILTVAGNHMTMDMTGLGMVISLLSKACLAEQFSEEEIQQGNRSRGDAVPLLGEDYEPGPELDDAYMKPRATEEKNNPSPTSEPTTTFSLPHPPPKWVYFNFGASALSTLKRQASNQTITPYISTDDAVGALCWQGISRARALRLGDQVRTVFARPISARKYLGLQGLYIGHMVDMVYSTATDVHAHPLGPTAGRLRSLLLEDAKITQHVRAFATMLDRLDDKSVLVNGACLDPQRDIVLSSYANIRCCELSFGPVLGRPDAARRPSMPPWPSLCYLMPKSRAGDIAVALCLSEVDIAALRSDKAFTEFAEYVG
ncbi:hypothetical protein LTR84_002100 [Exophiala bonariae]|uniref:Trichothecene 3-O-acetyltransferase-like N-terminal domain-containing protein n=1 Tax=Exophiala bonariae TaxID=1690606 RepID=A0AAV9NAG5_9EURO|nr:hypothetical protein LTR84_002100 [Exophiala bonariae]